VSYALENAIHQWTDGERRVRDAEPLEAADLERAVELVGDELRRRLGSSFEIAELVSLYGSGTDWAEDIASHHWAGTDTAAVVDCAFGRYTRGATDYAGGRQRRGGEE